MKIVGRKTFLSMPAGTVFSKYTPCVFGDLEIKGDSRMPGDRPDDVGDFWAQQIAGAVAASSDMELFDLLDQAEAGAALRMDLNCEYRDGLYDGGQLFAVWEPEDVRSLIARLQSTLES